MVSSREILPYPRPHFFYCSALTHADFALDFLPDCVHLCVSDERGHVPPRQSATLLLCHLAMCPTSCLTLSCSPDTSHLLLLDAEPSLTRFPFGVHCGDRRRQGPRRAMPRTATVLSPLRHTVIPVTGGDHFLLNGSISFSSNPFERAQPRRAMKL